MKGRMPKEAGAYLVLTSIFAILALVLIGTMFALGVLTTGKSKMQNISNLAALGALEAFMSSAAGGADYFTRAQAALTRANQLLQQNKMLYTSAPLGGLVLSGIGGPSGGGGELIFGRWETNTTAVPPCPGGRYPCFMPNDNSCNTGGSTCRANAVRLRLKNEPTNPLIVPFKNLWGPEALNVGASALAAQVERCVAFVVDTSGSSTFDSHRGPAFSYYLGSKPSFDCSGFGAAWCGANRPVSSTQRWCCNVKQTGSRPGNGTVQNDERYVDDYVAVDTPAGRFMIDTIIEDPAGTDAYAGPEPLATFLRAFNAGVVGLKEAAVAGDRATIIPFATNLSEGRTRNMTEDFDFLLQILNVRNGIQRYYSAGTYTQVGSTTTPNFMTRLMFPNETFLGSDTNIIQALNEAIDQLTLTTRPNHCGEDARKVIILATDGIANCPGGDPTQCSADQWSAVKSSYDEIASTVLGRLNNNKIALTTMLNGEYVMPHFLNVQGPSGTGFYDFAAAKSHNYLGYIHALTCTSGPPTCNFFFQLSNQPGQEFDLNAAQTDFNNLITDLNNGGAINARFPLANALWGEMAMRTGGVWCPLQPEDPRSACYDANDRLLDSCRTANAPQLHAIERITRTRQAIRCVQESIGNNPFQLVEEDPQ